MQAFITGAATNNSRRGSWTKYPWLPQEDAALVNLVNIQGPRNWNKIADHIPNRTGNACRLRWLTQLNPEVNRLAFSEAENQTLLRLYRSYGSNWSTIANHLPGRNSIQVRNQCQSLIERNIKVAKNQREALIRRLAYLSSHRCLLTVGSQFFRPPFIRYNFIGFARAEIHLRGIGSQGATYDDSMMRDDPGAESRRDVEFIDFMGVGTSG